MTEVKIAKLMPRMGGALIDLIVVIIVTAILMFTWGLVVGLRGSDASLTKEESEILWNGRALLVGLLVDSFYTVTTQASKLRATFGQKAMGLKIITETYERAGVGRLLFRYLVSVFSSLLIKIGFCIAIFTQKRQTLHDLMAGVIVVVANDDMNFESVYKEESKSDSDTSFAKIIPVISALMIVGTVALLYRHYAI